MKVVDEEEAYSNTKQEVEELEEDEVEEEDQEFLVIRPSTSATSSVITLGNARFLDVRKSLLLRKALVEDQKQEVVAVSTSANAAITSCIRPTTSAVNDCEPD